MVNLRCPYGLVSLLLAFAPFLTLSELSTYPQGLVWALSALTALIGAYGFIRGKGIGMAGMFSAIASSVMLVLGSGFVPYLTKFSLGSIPEAFSPYVGFSVAVATYGHFLGNAYESANRLSKRLGKMGYDAADMSQVGTMNLLIALVGAGLLAVSVLIYVVMELAPLGLIKNSLLALALFLVGYGIAMALARRRAQAGVPTEVGSSGDYDSLYAGSTVQLVTGNLPTSAFIRGVPFPVDERRPSQIAKALSGGLDFLRIREAVRCGRGSPNG